jgi:hypothetical protein
MCSPDGAVKRTFVPVYSALPILIGNADRCTQVM